MLMIRHSDHSKNTDAGSKCPTVSPLICLPCRISPISDCCRFWAAGTTEAICYLHSKGIAFRDLKPENLLIDQHGYLILIDLGFAKALPYKVTKKDGTVVTEHQTYTLCGTVEYLAPELFFDGHGHDHAVDYWALGCVIFELVQVSAYASSRGGPFSAVY